MRAAGLIRRISDTCVAATQPYITAVLRRSAHETNPSLVLAAYRGSSVVPLGVVRLFGVRVLKHVDQLVEGLEVALGGGSVAFGPT